MLLLSLSAICYAYVIHSIMYRHLSILTVHCRWSSNAYCMTLVNYTWFYAWNRQTMHISVLMSHGQLILINLTNIIYGSLAWIAWWFLFIYLFFTPWNRCHICSNLIHFINLQDPQLSLSLSFRHTIQQQTNKVITSTSQLIKQLSDIIRGSSRVKYNFKFPDLCISTVLPQTSHIIHYGKEWHSRHG